MKKTNQSQNKISHWNASGRVIILTLNISPSPTMQLKKISNSVQLIHKILFKSCLVPKYKSKVRMRSWWSPNISRRLKLLDCMKMGLWWESGFNPQFPILQRDSCIVRCRRHQLADKRVPRPVTAIQKGLFIEDLKDELSDFPHWSNFAPSYSCCNIFPLLWTSCHSKVPG